MAALDYWLIKEAIKARLEADPLTNHMSVVIHSLVQPIPELMPWVGIFMTNRVAPPREQKLAMGTTTDMTMGLTLVVAEYSLESLEEAVRRRDNAVGAVEVALIRNRTLGGAVDHLWLQGGNFFDQPADRGWTALGEIIMQCRSQLTT